MSDYISKNEVVEYLNQECEAGCIDVFSAHQRREIFREAIECIESFETIDAETVVRCKDCKHRPKRTGDEGNGFDYEFPDYKCPCRCDDGWYNRMPKDNWFCGNGERKEV